MSQIEPGSYPPGIPVPPAALVYSSPHLERRPGLITAIGVMSIVVGSLSILASLATGLNAYGFLMLSQVTARLSRTVAVSSTPSAVPTAAQATASGALPAGDAGVAVNTLAPLLSLDGPHERELDRMMRLHGRQVFGGDDDTPLTGSTIRDAVQSSRPMTPAASEPAQFVTAQGTVDVYADHATFTAADGATTADTSAIHGRDSTVHGSHSSVNLSPSMTMNVTASRGGLGSVALTPGASTTLPATEVAAAVQAAKDAATPPLNAAQIQALQAELSKPDQSLVTVASVAPVNFAGTDPTGQVTISFDTGNQLVLGPAGQVVRAGRPPIPKFNVSPAWIGAVVIEAFASAALAALLIVAGIIVLRGSFAAPRLLRIYAWTKIPLAILAGVGLAVIGGQFYDSIANMGGPTAAAATSGKVGYGIFGFTVSLLGLAFAIALLITLRARTVRRYFNSIA